MYRAASHSLSAAGFEHYEVSNYARAGHRSRHNAAYWRNEPFLALGLGATSHLRNVRLARPRTMGAYEKWVGALESTGWEASVARAAEAGDAVREEGREALTTLLMLRLRTRDGVDFDELRARFGAELGGAAAAACEAAASELPSEWARLTPRLAPASAGSSGAASAGTSSGASSAGTSGPASTEGEWSGMALLDPDGFLFSNDAIATVFARLDELSPEDDDEEEEG